MAAQKPITDYLVHRNSSTRATAPKGMTFNLFPLSVRRKFCQYIEHCRTLSAMTGHIQEAAFVLQCWLPVMLNTPVGSHPGSEVVNKTLRLPING